MIAAAVSEAEFAQLMAPLQPFEPQPSLAVAVSGGADSMALCLLAAHWAAGRNGSVVALIVDHGIRAESADEARATAARLAGLHIGARILPVEGLTRGPALAERARIARYRALEAACRQQGIVHLLLAHHMLDQAETLLMRALSGSGDAGLAAMPAIAERTHVRLLRPLLEVPPERLRETLRLAGLGWVEDPSNRDVAALRPRLRGSIGAASVLARATFAAGGARLVQEQRIAEELAGVASFHEEGFALLRPGAMSAPALAAVIRMVAGRRYPVHSQLLQDLAHHPRPATLGGARLLHSGRFGPGFLVVREGAAMQPAVAARPGAVWDHRFRLLTQAAAGDTEFGALGAAAAEFRKLSDLPAAVLRTIPALWRGGRPLLVPHLEGGLRIVVFDPPVASAGAPFLVAGSDHAMLAENTPA